MTNEPDIFDLFSDILDGVSFEHPKTHSIFENSTGMPVRCKYCNSSSNWILVSRLKRYECQHDFNVHTVSFWEVYSDDVDNGLEKL